jgi:ABC-2 type transport system ATP-binding protein
MIAGLIPFEGDIFLRDTSLKNQPVGYRSQVSWAEAEPLFPGFLKGIELLMLHLKVRKSSQKQMEGLISLFGLSNFINDPVETYSAGMVKKLSLALAFKATLP